VSQQRRCKCCIYVSFDLYLGLYCFPLTSVQMQLFHLVHVGFLFLVSFGE
jgi:hypothetical protein